MWGSLFFGTQGANSGSVSIKWFDTAIVYNNINRCSLHNHAAKRPCSLNQWCKSQKQIGGRIFWKDNFPPLIPIKETSGVSCGKLPGKLVASLDNKIAPIVPQVWILDDESSDVIFTWLHWSVHHCYNTYSLGPEWQGCLFGIGEETFLKELVEWQVEKIRRCGQANQLVILFFFPNRVRSAFCSVLFLVWHSWGLWYRRPSELLECLGPNLLSMQPARFNFPGLFHGGQLHV